MKVDGLAIYFTDGMKGFASDPRDGSDRQIVEECGVDFHDDGVHFPYVKDKGETYVFVGFPFFYTIKESGVGEGEAPKRGAG